MRKYILLILLLAFSCHGFADEADLNTAFKNYQSGDFESSKTLWEEALKSHPHNSYLIYNLGLTEYKRGKVGAALALWRRALSINPQLSSARRAIQFAINQMPSKPLATHVESSMGWIEKMITDNVSLNVLWPFLLVLFALFGRSLFRFLATRKRAFLNDEPSPAVPTRLIVYGIAFLILGLASFVSLSDLLQEKATVITSSAQAKTGPSADMASLFDIPEGTELLIYDKQNSWYKVEDPTGRMGWVSADQVYITSDKLL